MLPLFPETPPTPRSRWERNASDLVLRPESLSNRTRCPRAEGACPADSSAARMAQALAVSAAQSPEPPTRRRGDNGFIMRREVAAEAEAGHGQAELDRESSQAHERDVRASLKRKTAHTCLSLNRSVGRTFGGGIESRKEDTRGNIPIWAEDSAPRSGGV